MSPECWAELRSGVVLGGGACRHVPKGWEAGLGWVLLTSEVDCLAVPPTPGPVGFLPTERHPPQPKPAQVLRAGGE